MLRFNIKEDADQECWQRGSLYFCISVFTKIAFQCVVTTFVVVLHRLVHFRLFKIVLQKKKKVTKDKVNEKVIL